MSAKKIAAVMLCLLLALAVGACGRQAATEEAGETAASAGETETAETAAVTETVDPEPAGDAAGLPAPLVDCTGTEEAQAVAGFDFDLPPAAEEADSQLHASEELQLYEVIYEDEGALLCLRKAAGEGDISGVYLDFSQRETVTAGEKVVTIQGNGAGDILACWQAGGYSYSVYAVDGIDREHMLRVIAAVD